MNQHTFVKERLSFYEEQGLTPEPGGEWQEAHYPDPRDVGNKTIWMLHNDHQQQGLYQSEEYGRPCFYNYDTLRFLTHGPFVPGWFDLWDLYDKWSGYNGRETILRCNGHPNTEAVRSENGKRSAPGLGTQEGRTKGGKRAGEKTGGENGRRSSKPIVCVETGFFYPSSEEASRKTGIHGSSIRRSCRTGCRAGGLHWRFTDSARN